MAKSEYGLGVLLAFVRLLHELSAADPEGSATYMTFSVAK